MACATVRHSPSPESVFDEDSEEHSNVMILIEKATDHFIFKEFCLCIEDCSRTISWTKAFPDCSRCGGAKSALTVLAIQAYAELNQWDLVLPFVQKVYGNVESCPARVMQLCLLLHARVKQFVQCHAMAKVWLQYNANHGVHGYTDVAELYVRQILIPLGAYNLIPQFVENCTELTSEEKRELLSPVNKSKNEMFSFKRTRSTSSSCPTVSRRETFYDKQPKPKHSSTEKRFEIIRTLWCRLQKVILCWKDSTVCRVLVMATLGTIALIHTQFGDPFCGLSRAFKVWDAIIRVWNRICAS